MAQNKPDAHIKLGLSNIHILLEKLNNPHLQLKNIVHIAGTNGKGSTLFALEQILLQTVSGIKIGRYTSPHLTCVTERFSINNIKISQEYFLKYFKYIENIIEQYELQATYFEKLTALAFIYFATEQPDIILLETGLGGRLDATNIINPILSIITNVSLDHQEYLGNTLSQIAQEKAGIIKRATPYMTMISSELKGALTNIAQELKAPEVKIKQYALPDSLPAYQKDNLLLAINAAYYIVEYCKLSNNLPELNFDSLNLLPGRFQIKELNEGAIIIDGAHNVAGAQSLIEGISLQFPEKKTVWLMGLLRTKDYKSFLECLFKNNSQALTVVLTYPSELEVSVELEDLKSTLEQINSTTLILVQSDCQKALKSFKAQLKKERNAIGIITGSLYLIGNLDI